MAWETRGNSRYYYTAQRQGGRVVKSYVGAAGWVESAARLDALDRDRKQRERLTEQGRRQIEQNALAFLSEALRGAAGLASLLMEAAGYHRHDRGRWRKKRMKFENRTDKSKRIEDAAPLIPANPSERHALVVKAMDSKETKAQALAVAILRKYPDEVVSAFLSEVNNAVSRLAEGNPVGEQLLLNDADRMRKKLREGRAAEAIPYAESLLIERVVTCRFALIHAESQLQGNMSLPLGDYRQRTIDRAHKRYLSAIKTLSEVRRLALPSVSVALPGSTQVNIGEKQINLCQGSVIADAGSS